MILHTKVDPQDVIAIMPFGKIMAVGHDRSYAMPIS